MNQEKENKARDFLSEQAGASKPQTVSRVLTAFSRQKADRIPVSGSSLVEMENEIINILAGSSLFKDLESEDRQELVNHLVSLLYH